MVRDSLHFSRKSTNATNRVKESLVANQRIPHENQSITQVNHEFVKDVNGTLRTPSNEMHVDFRTKLAANSLQKML